MHTYWEKETSIIQIHRRVLLKTRSICNLEWCTVMHNSSSFAPVTVNSFVYRFIRTLKTLQLYTILCIPGFIVGEEFNYVFISATALYRWIFSSGLEKFTQRFMYVRGQERNRCVLYKTCIDNIWKEWSCAFSCEHWSKDNGTDHVWFKSFFKRA